MTSITLTVANALPSIDAVAIDPSPPIDTDTLTCSHTGFADADGDGDSSTVQWAINGVDAGTAATLTAAIAVDDFVTCTVTPNDGIGSGAAVTASARVGASTPDDDGGDSSGGDSGGGSDGGSGSDADAASTDVTFAIADYEFVGEGSGDYAGQSVANAGDVDGDGLDDLLVGAFSNDDVAETAGKVYLFYGKTLADRTRINLARADYSFLVEYSYDEAGSSVASAGDVDGDGKADILVGARYRDFGGSNSGAVYLILSSSLEPGEDADGRVEHTMSLSEADFKFYGESSGIHVGWTVASAGDIDGDDRDDIMFSAYSPAYGSGYWGRGRVHIATAASLDGRSGWIPATSVDHIIDGEAEYDRLYNAIASAGDVDGDGLDDIILGAAENDSAGLNAGMAYVLLGSSFGSTRDVSLADASYRISGAYGSDLAGYSVAGGGDIDGDGLSDVLIGAKNNPDGGVRAGSVYVLFGSRFGTEQDLDLYLDADYQLIGENDYDEVGFSVANAGDVDGDGLDDIVLGSESLKNDVPSNVGGVYIFLARDLGPAVPISLAEADQRIIGEEGADYAGRSVSGGGDLNGDGFDDVIVGAPEAESGGMTYLLFGE